MTKDNRVRRVALLCSHFIRNLAYSRAILDFLPAKPRDFWLTAAGGCLDTAVLEWHKLFVDAGGSHHWKQVVPDPDAFRAKILAVGISEDQWKAAISEVRAYRNKFVAHLLSDETMKIPDLRRPKIMAEMYFFELDALYSTPSASHGLPKDLGNYFRMSYSEAELVCKAHRE